MSVSLGDYARNLDTKISYCIGAFHLDIPACCLRCGEGRANHLNGMWAAAVVTTGNYVNCVTVAVKTNNKSAIIVSLSKPNFKIIFMPLQHKKCSLLSGQFNKTGMWGRGWGSYTHTHTQGRNKTYRNIDLLTYLDDVQTSKQ